MESLQKHPFKDFLFLSGLAFIAVSAIIFALPVYGSQPLSSDSFFGLFFIHYSIAIIYLVMASVQGFIKSGWRLGQNNIIYSLLFLILALISAFALNREMNVFQDSTSWLTVALIIACVTCIVYSFQAYLPVFARHILFFILGAAFLLFIYFSIYLLPLYGIGLMAFFFLGISLHTFVPLLFCIYLFLVLKKAYLQNKGFIWSIVAGFTLPLLFFSYFLTQWIDTQQLIRDSADETIMNSDQKLPQWVTLSQKLPANWISEKVIKSGLVYDMPLKDGGFWRMPNQSFDEIKKHDPLVITAAYLYNHYELEDKERIKILEVLYDSRHQAQDRLWSGKDLRTSHVITNARVFSQHRLAYTEKIISIQNIGRQESWWTNEQEAIYTFHMPEGSVVTSLSLWINGIEEKAYLTTKSKADSAYKTIVGVEVRDPSVVHWQEGNTVSVRVFPCSPSANRRFKIGFTSPLRKEKDSLVYENIYFQGPSFKDATENIQIEFEDQHQGVDAPIAFTSSHANGYQYKGSYKPYWELSCTSPKLSDKSFSFNGKTYQMQEYKESLEAFSPEKIYLDINQSWTNDEFEQIWALTKDKGVYVYSNEMVKLDESSKDEWFESLQGLKFSLFPVHEIKNPEKALVISKSNMPSPNLNDIKESPFCQSLKKGLQDKQTIRLFNLGHQLSPYLKTLKELRVFTYAHGEVDFLKELLQNKQFVKQTENEQSIVINHAQVSITEKEGVLSSQAPDHLLRLYAYNNIMRKVNTNYLADNFITDSIIAEAEKAYVVSPVSSLIVLETKKDYERFDIQESKNSLKNASVKSSGAVPEPHEWMLIILSIGVITFFICKNYLFK